MQQIEIKQGSTFILTFTLSDADGNPLAPPTGDLRMELRKASDSSSVAVLDITETATASTYEASYSGSTEAWPLGVLFADIRAAIDGDIRYSNTLAVSVVKSYTQGAAP